MWSAIILMVLCLFQGEAQAQFATVFLPKNYENNQGILIPVELVFPGRAESSQSKQMMAALKALTDVYLRPMEEGYSAPLPAKCIVWVWQLKNTWTRETTPPQLRIECRSLALSGSGKDLEKIRTFGSPADAEAFLRAFSQDYLHQVRENGLKQVRGPTLPT